MRPRRFTVLFCAAIGTCAGGCDPVRTALQVVHIRVTDATGGRAVAEAEVGLKYDYERAEPISQETHDQPEIWHEYNRKYWHQRPWFEGRTDADGTIAAAIVNTEIDHTPGFWPRPPGWRDESGKPYLVRLTVAGVQETLSVVLRPGATSRGKSFSVAVIEVEAPQYIPTDS